MSQGKKLRSEPVFWGYLPIGVLLAAFHKFLHILRDSGITGMVTFFEIPYKSKKCSMLRDPGRVFGPNVDFISSYTNFGILGIYHRSGSLCIA